MAYTPCYPNKINWQNDPSEATALNDVNLNKMDSAIHTIDGRVVDMSTRLDTDDTAITNLQGNVSDLQGDMTTAQGNITALQNGKVDKETGKGLSQVDDVTVTQHVAYGTVVSTIKTYKQDGTEVTSQVCNGIVVDSALSDSSTNPVQNKVVKSAIDEKSTVAISDTLATGTTLANITIDGTTTAIKGSDIEVDEELSPTSTNPVENKAIYDELNNLLPSKTVSGNPIAISDASGFNAKALTVSMNPIQDLHGYDHPWAGGAGKNKLDLANASLTKPSWYGGGWNDASLNDGNGLTLPRTYNQGGCGGFVIPAISGDFVISIKGDGTSAYNCGVWYTTDGTDSIEVRGASSRMTAYGTNRHYLTFTIHATAQSIAFRPTCANNITAPYDIYDIMIESGSTPSATFAPYSNICPISGRTEASVKRTGKNLVKTVDWGGNQYKCQGYGVNGGSPKLSFNGKLKSGTYTLSLLFKNLGNVAEGSRQGLIRLWVVKDNTVYNFDTSTGALSTSTVGGNFIFDYNANFPANNTRIFSNPFKIAEDIDEIRMGIYQSGKYVEIDEIQIELGSSGSEYEPYQGETHTKEFGQTVYGGILDFVNGELIVDIPSTAKVKLSDLNWTYQSAQSRFYTADLASLIKKPSTSSDIPSGMMCECYKIDSFSNLSNGKIAVETSGNLFAKDENYTDVTTWLNAVGDYYIDYPLATPTTIQLSPEALTLLKGLNVISTDGDDMELKYSVSLDSLLPTE